MPEHNRPLEVGVFLPVGNGGWITSENSPEYPPTYEYNKQVARLAEDMGWDFALSMAAWRGFDGKTKHWNTTLESITSMSGIAEATSRIGVWGTVHTMIFHPAVLAKMAAVLDQVSAGRFGLNIVAGSRPADQQQMGLWWDLAHDERYELAEEWLTVVKRLWTEDRVTHDGKFFHLDDCMSDPKPRAIPPIICAGGSDRGFRFTVDHCSGSFFLGSSDDDFISVANRARAIADEKGRPEFKTYGLFTIVPGETDADALKRVEHFNSGADLEALANRTSDYSKDKTLAQNTMANRFISQGNNAQAITPAHISGSPETIARRIARMVTEGDVDGITVIVPDFIEDLTVVGEQVIPLLADMGVTVPAAERMKESEVAA